MTEGFRPTLLLSMPQMQDPNFARTVVLLCDYLPEGAFGLVLNRPTDMPASEMVRLDPPVVARQPAAAVHRRTGAAGARLDPGRRAAGRTGLPDGHRRALPLDLAGSCCARVLEAPTEPRARVVAGYAGWGPGQLDDELAQSAWLMADVELDLVFDVDAQ